MNSGTVDDCDATTVQVSHVTGTKQNRKNNPLKDGTATNSGSDDDSGVLLFEAANDDAVVLDISEEQFQESLRTDAQDKTVVQTDEDKHFHVQTANEIKKNANNFDSILDDLEALEASSPLSATEEKEGALPTAATFRFVEEPQAQQQQVSHPHNIEEATTDSEDEDEEAPPDGETFLQFNKGLVETRPFEGQELVLNRSATDHSSSQQDSTTDPVFMVGDKDIDEPLPYSSKKKYPRKLFGLVLLILASLGLVATVLGLVLRDSDSKTDNVANSAVEATTSEVGENETIATLPPTASATEPPESPSAATPTTESPTFAETPADPFMLKVYNLPEYTKESLNDPTSPQSKALEWVLQHPMVASGTMLEWRQLQLFALATFYYSFGGPHWDYNDDDTAWLDYDTSECEWRHSRSIQGLNSQAEFDTSSNEKNDPVVVAPCNSEGEYEALVLSGLFQQSLEEELDATSLSLPPELALLSSLKIIQLYDNNLPAVSSLLYLLPSRVQMADFVAVETFVFADEPALSGSIPSELTLWKNLKKLVLVGTSLSGTVPPAIGQLPLQILYLANNRLSGSIPVSIVGNINDKNGASIINSLEYLSLASNSLTGTIPKQMGLFTALRELDLSENPSLSGSIPEEIGQLVVPPGGDQTDYTLNDKEGSTRLRYVNISGNERLNGEVPRELCQLNRKTTRAAGCSYPAPNELISDESSRSCALEFDCTHLLCGCSCICSS